jgi:hypothetical protein
MIAYLLFLHFVSDFILQTRYMATNKSIRVSVLLEHLAIIGLTFVIGLSPLTGLLRATAYTGINIVIHGLIDWNIWNVYKYWVGRRLGTKRLDGFRYWEDHLFYVTIGFDQLLHALTLVLFAPLLFN